MILKVATTTLCENQSVLAMYTILETKQKFLEPRDSMYIGFIGFISPLLASKGKFYCQQHGVRNVKH